MNIEERKVAGFKLNDTQIDVYLLNPGEVFPGFGGSRSGLLVRKTASLIVRQTSPGGLYDTEYSIHDQQAWARLFRCAVLAHYWPA